MTALKTVLIAIGAIVAYLALDANLGNFWNYTARPSVEGP